jgi:hypothetical protein
VGDSIEIGKPTAAQYSKIASLDGNELDKDILVTIGEISSEFAGSAETGLADFNNFTTIYSSNIKHQLKEILHQKELLTSARSYMASSTGIVNYSVLSAQNSIPDFPNIIQEMTEDLAAIAIKLTQNSDHWNLVSIAQKEKEDTLYSRPLEGDEGLYMALDDAKHANFAALKSVGSLKKPEFEDFKNFTAPPAPVLRLTDALCILFDKSPSWPVAKSLLNVNLARGLELLNVKAISESKFDKLKRNADILAVKIPGLQTNWTAVRSIANWICSFVTYALLLKQMESNAKINRKME